MRHPLAFIMEAADDIAYSVLDVEDSVKKGIVSVWDVLTWLRDKESDGASSMIRTIVEKTENDAKDYKGFDLSPGELNDVTMQKLRVYCIGEMVNSTVEAFKKNVNCMLAGNYDKELISDCEAGVVRDAMKAFAKRHSFTHRSVLKVELAGYNVINDLMDMIWRAIENHREGGSDTFSRYVYTRISENYRRVYENGVRDAKLVSKPNVDEESDKNPIVESVHDYYLLADMIAGMTDRFAMSLHKDLVSSMPTPMR